MTNNGHWTGDGGFAVFWMIVFGLAMALFIILVVKYFIDARISEGGSESNPLEMVESRYAKGEITKKEFDQMKKDLK